MEIQFTVTKEERKALVKAVGDIIGWAPVYKGAPSFAFAVSNYIIDRNGVLIYDERMDAQDAGRLLSELTARGFAYEGVVGLEGFTESEHAGGAPEDAISNETSDTDAPAKKAIIVDMPFFGDSALDNLRKMIAGKAALIQKSIGADDLTVAVIGGALYFHWFDPDSTERELEAYKQFVSALCLTAQNQKRVTMKESAVDSEKFAFRCFLLKLGFIGDKYAAARKVLLSKLSGSGSFKSGDHKSRGTRGGPAAVIGGADTAVPRRCEGCRHHCYYTTGELRDSAGAVVDTSHRAPVTYTHYCLNSPNGFRRLKHAAEWSGQETPPRWCPMKTAEATVCEAADYTSSLAETLADAELIHAANMSCAMEGGGV